MLPYRVGMEINQISVIYVSIVLAHVSAAAQVICYKRARGFWDVEPLFAHVFQLTSVGFHLDREQRQRAESLHIFELLAYIASEESEPSSRLYNCYFGH